MATKKAPAKKAPAKKAPVKKTAKAAPTKRTTAVTAKKRTTKKAKTAPMRSFKVYRPEESFTTVRFSRQTVYWTVLLVVILITQLWILNLQLDITELTNELITSANDI